MSNASAPRAVPLSIERLIVRADRLVCEVAVALTVPRSTSPELLARVCAEHPHLPLHACVNEEGDTFAEVMDHTSLPHLLEHLVIDMQAQATSDTSALFVGTSEWIDEGAGRARIEVSFTDDLVALRAFRDAIAFLNNTVVPWLP